MPKKESIRIEREPLMASTYACNIVQSQFMVFYSAFEFNHLCSQQRGNNPQISQENLDFVREEIFNKRQGTVTTENINGETLRFEVAPNGRSINVFIGDANPDIAQKQRGSRADILTFLKGTLPPENPATIPVPLGTQRFLTTRYFSNAA